MAAQRASFGDCTPVAFQSLSALPPDIKLSVGEALNSSRRRLYWNAMPVVPVGVHEIPTLRFAQVVRESHARLGGIQDGLSETG